MKEKPIFFSEEMVLAVLAGRKTQTRRPVKFKFRDGCRDASTLQVGNYCTGHPRSGFVLRGGAGGCWKDVTHPLQCPYGNKGDRLWVRETWSDVNYDGSEAIAYRADSEVNLLSNDSTFLDDVGVFNPHDVRLAKLHFGNWYADLIAGTEGRWRPSIHMPRWASRIQLEITNVRIERLKHVPREGVLAEGYPIERQEWANEYDPFIWFKDLWGSIYGDKHWDTNPWVWVVEFRRCE